MSEGRAENKARIHLFTNNSDEEQEQEQVEGEEEDYGVVKGKQQDFTSFPTLPDADQEHSKILTKIFTKTLRKVTNNATQLVQSYSSPKHDKSHERVGDALEDSPVRFPSLATTIVEDDGGDNGTKKGGSGSKPKRPPLQSTSLKVESIVDEHDSIGLAPEIVVPDKSDRMYSISQNSEIKAMAGSLSSANPSIVHLDNLSLKSFDRASAVSPISKSLALTNISLPHLQLQNKLSNSGTTSSLATVNAIASTDKGREHAKASNTRGEESNFANNEVQDDNSSQSPDVKKSLQNRISTIFNNLPNDIELSDDSASDVETLNVSTTSSPPRTTQFSEQLPKSTSSLFRETKTSLSELNSQNPLLNRLSKNKSTKRKSSLNMSNTLLENAKNMLPTNIASAAVSSASSIVPSRSGSKKKKKKKPKKTSENPLKSGGIPRKYWMNDSFVSDCLNCFKPFTAFRRKHHCRFCGQIFCSDCTLFISYKRHKEERKLTYSPAKKDYNDKLRVCKPCYSDVIVYLSDDSSSSNEVNDDIEDTFDAGIQINEALRSTQLPLSKIRSSSVHSYRESILNDTHSKGSHYPQRKDSLYLPSIEPSEDSKSLLMLNNSTDSSKLGGSLETGHFVHAPQMTIPATRKGEAVEIPVNTSSYASNSHVSLAANGIMTSSNYNNSVANESQSSGSFFKLYPQTKNPNITSDLPSRSFGNTNPMYGSVFNKRLNKRYQGTLTDPERKYHQNALQSEFTTRLSDSESDTDLGDDGRDDSNSENEDEQVMSLYTSLNHFDPNGNGNISALSPRPIGGPHILGTANQTVPTLGEFPKMQTDNIFIPRNYKKVESSLFSKLMNSGSPNAVFELDSVSKESPSSNRIQFSFLEERPKSFNTRSHERAHASLLRMRSRRRSKSIKAVNSLTQKSMPPNILTGNLNFSPPLSPSPKSLTANSQTSNILTSSLTRGLNNVNDLSASSGSKNPGSSAHLPLDQSSPTSYTQAKPLFGEESSVSRNKTVLELGDNEKNTCGQEDIFSEFENYKELETVYRDHLNTLMIQCLDDCEINKDQKEWSKKLFEVLDNIRSLKVIDTLDIRQYVKIKKLLGGTIQDTNVIDGLFITKDIDSRMMPSEIKNPKIALLMFPIEYLKQKEQFISLRVVHSQQSVYITNLVSRIVTLEPDVVIVGDTVCGLAEKLLKDANITVISNTKPQVIERISRYTKANIFQSINDLFFKKGSLGTCKLFQVRKYCFKDIVKTYIFFSGGDIESGFTISLRGGDEETLNGVKYTVETLISGVLNARFEEKYLADQNLKLAANLSNPSIVRPLQLIDDSMVTKETVVSNDHLMGAKDTLDNIEATNYIKLFEERILSTSPFISVILPIPLCNVVSSYNSIVEFYHKSNTIHSLPNIEDIDQLLIKELDINLDIATLPNGSEDYIQILKYICDLHLKSLVQDFQYRARIWSNCMSLPTYQLYPVFHKSLHLLHSTVSMKFATPCAGPNIVMIDYYSDNDKCLGLYLDQLFQDSMKTCEECGFPLLNHYQSYVHANAKLDFMIEKYNYSLNEIDSSIRNQRFMWSCCKICKCTSPIVPMSEATYYFSIGKLFELSLWGAGLELHNSPCKHNFFKNHVRYFSFNDQVIRMEYSPIDVYEVVLPKKQLEYIPNIDVELKVETFNHIKSKTSNFFQSITNRLNRVKVDTFDKAEDGKKKIEELKLKVNDQANTLDKRALKIYKSTSPTSHLPLNSILRELQELGVAWDKEFQEFEKKFLPSENEITKITQFHLKKFLADKYNSDGHQKDADVALVSGDSHEKPLEGEMQKENDDNSMQRDSDLPTCSLNSRNNYLSDSLNIERTKEIGKFIPSSLYQNTNVTEKVSRMEAILKHEKEDSQTTSTTNVQKSSPKLSQESSLKDMNFSQGQSNSQKQNKVTQLANFFNQMNFDQISKEFQKQREKELEKKLTKFKAFPIVASKPIVEIYNNIEDVVDVNDDHDSERKEQKKPSKLGKVKRQNSYDIRVDDFAEEKVAASKQNKEKDGQMEKEKESDKSKEKTSELAQPEKMSLLKSLTNFWADRSATLWDPLEYPLDHNEHTFADSDVIVREDEPSSLIAFCLSSSDYKQKIKLMADNKNNEGLEANECNVKKLNNFSKIEKKFKKRSPDENNMNEFEEIMTKNKSNHLKYQYLDGNTNLSCKIFYSEQFEAFRKACDNDTSFIQSLSRCIKWNSSGGKSGSSFLKTLDNRYILKELSKSELESFVSIAPFYFKYISQSMFHTLSSAMAKIFGFYQIQIKNTDTGKTFKMDFLIMENLFYSHNTTRIFDLKGSMRNRHVKQTGKENEVLLDENMIEYIYESPVFVNEHLKKLLRGSLFNDTSFLSAMDVMDYSLIIGIDDSSKKLFIGIIDWLRAFTWDKKVENWVKGKNIIGGGRKGKDPTIITPKQYRTRFREAMERYILEVPDFWYEGK